MTLEELTRVIQYAVTAYDRELTEDLLAVYFDQLRKYEWQPVAAAVRHHVATVERFPTVADIRSAMATLNRRNPDPVVRRNDMIAKRVIDARKAGKSQDEVDALIESLERSLSVRE